MATSPTAPAAPSSCPHDGAPLGREQVAELAEDYLSGIPDLAVAVHYGLCLAALQAVLGGPKPACLSRCVGGGVA